MEVELDEVKGVPVEDGVAGVARRELDMEPLPVRVLLDLPRQRLVIADFEEPRLEVAGDWLLDPDGRLLLPDLAPAHAVAPQFMVLDRRTPMIPVAAE